MSASSKTYDDILNAVASVQHPAYDLSPRARLVFYIRQLTDEHRLTALEFEELMKCVRHNGSYLDEKLPFFNQGGRLYFTQTDKSGNYVDVAQHYKLPLEEIIDELTMLDCRYMEARKQDVSLERGLLTFLGDSRDAERVILKLLADNQDVRSIEVRECWPLIIDGIEAGWFPVEEIEACVVSTKEP